MCKHSLCDKNRKTANFCKNLKFILRFMAKGAIINKNVKYYNLIYIFIGSDKMASVIKSIGIFGLEGYVVDVEVSVFDGIAMTSIVGLGDTAVKESRDRIETCLSQLEFIYPQKRIVINLSPSNVKKSGSYFDLAMLIGILLESGQIKPIDFVIDEYIFLGEISLNGELKSFSGVLPIIVNAKKNGINKIILPTSCYEEAIAVNGVEIFAFDNLEQVITYIERKIYLIPKKSKVKAKIDNKYRIDFSDVYGHKDIMEYVIVAAAGNHNILLNGAPGCGKSMIAKRIPTILPDMTENETLEISSIYSICGLLKNSNLIVERPFRSPHYNASANALIGGGANAMPGEISLAHNGILFLDELPEFSRTTLEALRQPLEDRKVTISRVKFTNIFPANFQLVAAMNPCPCGNLGSDRCNCSHYDIKRYTQRISGPILDRIDIQKYMGRVNLFESRNEHKNLSSKAIKEIVEKARIMQLKRFENINDINFNGQMDSSHIKELCPLDSECLDLLQKSYEKFQFSARTYNKIIKIARTFADIDESSEIYRKHIIFGLMSRDLDKDKNTLLVKNYA